MCILKKIDCIITTLFNRKKKTSSVFHPSSEINSEMKPITDASSLILPVIMSFSQNKVEALEGSINSSPPGQNGRHFADDVCRCIFVNEKFCILIKISLKFVAKGQIDNNQVSVIISLDNGLAPNRRQAIIWTNAEPVHWCIYASLGGDELKRISIEYIPWNMCTTCVLLCYDYYDIISSQQIPMIHLPWPSSSGLLH